MASGEELHFHRDGERFVAFAGIPVDAADSLRVSVLISRNGEPSDSIFAEIPLPAIPVDTARPREKLSVDSRFSRPDAAARARLAKESAMAMAVSRGAHETPRLWTDPFVRPRQSRITSQFGSGRVFNGELKSRHLGLDLAGAKGDPVRAANRGVVRLIGHFSLAGNCIYIDHGEGLVTAYFHLSHVAVAEGDTVARGQRIGSVGATGRVTGPHLHWVARYGGITIDPLSVVAATSKKDQPPR
jgi:murein DD-endopeptidase MepM/ murein hydrolase activator NlpD